MNSEKKKVHHPQKRFFPDNLHHKSQVAIYGESLKNARDSNAKGDHLFFENNYQSEYQHCYDEHAKKSIDKYLMDQKMHQIEAAIPQNTFIKKNEAPFAQHPSSPNNFSYEAKQQALKNNWNIQDMDPNSAMNRDRQNYMDTLDAQA